jgi:phospholipid transport system substrate-binding protein
MRRTTAVAMLWGVLIGASAWAGAEVAPDALARSVTEEVLTIVRADKDLQNGDPQRVLELVEAKVLPHFDFQRMTQLAAGRNWRQATPDQQKALVAEFRTLLVRTYTTAFTQYRNQTVDYQPAKMAPGDTHAVVRSLVRQPSGPPVSIDYGMERRPGGWKVFDIKIEGVSLIQNYRSSFNSEIQRSGVDGLIKVLVERNRALAAQAAARK